MLEYVIKRNGTTEVAHPAKINRWMQDIAGDLSERLDWGSVVMDVFKDAPATMTSQDLQKALVNKFISKHTWVNNLMGGRLNAIWHWKHLFGDEMPTVQLFQSQLVSIGLMEKLDYSQEDYDLIEIIIDHKRDLTLANFQIQQDIYKYGVANKITGQLYETPQFIFMRMAMALAENAPKRERIAEVKAWYDEFASSRVNPPTPNFNNLGTPHHGLASCCLYTTSDDARSIAIGDHIAFTMTYMSAGIGGMLNIRSILDPVRGGAVIHQGKLPYYAHTGKGVKSNLKGGRGGAMTQFVSVFDPEIEAICRTQNPRTPVKNQNRDIHFAVMYNSFFAKKAAQRKDIFFFNTFTAPDLMAKLFSDDRVGFAELYEAYEANPDFKKTYINAYELAFLFESQGHEVSTLYTLNIEEVNRHTSFLEPIFSSNLCQEIVQPTKPYKHITDLYRKDHHDGEVSLCNIAAIVVSKIKNDEEYYEACYRALKMIDRTIDLADYEFPHLEYTAKNRRNAAVGMAGVAELFARVGAKMDTPYGLAMAHKIAERHSYFVIKASLALGKELGNAPWIDKTKWPSGWLPIDTYKKTVDEITPHVLRYDWEALRAEIIANGGLRNSSLVAHMPTESSSKASGIPNGIYPVRDLYMKKTDDGAALDWCAPDDDLYGDNYQNAYDITTVDLIKYYAVFQKFADQSISADDYMDRQKKPTLEKDELVGNFLARAKYGVKSKYYQNSYTVEVAKLENSEQGNEPTEEGFAPNERAMCASGGCSA